MPTNTDRSVGSTPLDAVPAWLRPALVPVWNRRENRVRAFWRIAVPVVGVLVVSSLVGAAVVRPLDLPFAVTNLLSNLVPTLLVCGGILAWGVSAGDRSLRAYAARLDGKWWRLFALGVAVGLLGWGGALATNLAFGWASVAAVVSPGAGDLPFPVSVATFGLGWLLVGVWEELLFRGIVMRNAVEGLRFPSVPDGAAVVGGWVGSSVLFGLLHAGQATSPIALGFWVLAGLVLGLAYLLTDRLAYPIGLHAAFDLSFNNVFGLASVREAGRQVPTIVRPAFTGPEWLVGLSGAVNTGWLLVIGALTVAVIGWQYGSLAPRIGPYADGAT